MYIVVFIEWTIHALDTLHMCILKKNFIVGDFNLLTTHEWFQQLEAGREVCAVFFDLRKAFIRLCAP